ncbi:MAG: methyltransferase [Methylococcaceae bacterium]|nr:methyltransferase [Methylococcaceae bacterium]
MNTITESHHKRLLSPAAWFFYLLAGWEILFMISPAAIYYYSFYGDFLNVLDRWPETAWLTQFFLPHISMTRSFALNALHWVSGACLLIGAALFLAAAGQLYWSKFRRLGPVTNGLYAFSRHPQYIGLAVLGLGALLLWPRFLVLIAYVTMLFTYRFLAKEEERRCEARFGERYRVYQTGIGKLFSYRGFRAKTESADARSAFATMALGAIVSLILSVFIAGGLKEYTLSKITAFYENHTAVLSPAILSDEELRAAYHTALSDAGIQAVLAKAKGVSFIVHVEPEDWHLADLPIEIEPGRRAHHTPANFDRRYYKVLFSGARSHVSNTSGKDILRSAYGLQPLSLVKVDIETRKVTAVEAPPAQVIWGNIPTPLF